MWVGLWEERGVVTIWLNEPKGHSEIKMTSYVY